MFQRPFIQSGAALRDLSVAKQVAWEAAHKVSAGAIQLHGGMGMSLNHPIGHYYPKLLHVDTVFGTLDDHMSQLIEIDMNNMESTE